MIFLGAHEVDLTPDNKFPSTPSKTRCSLGQVEGIKERVLG